MIQPLYALVQRANATGAEIGITVVAGGRTVSGMLTPNQRFASWAQEVTARAAHEHGRTSFPIVDLPPISSMEAAGVQAAWRKRQRAPVEGTDGHAVDDSLAPAHFCLRNARVFATSDGELIGKYPYLLISLWAVEAFTLGFYAGEAGASALANGEG